MTHEKIGSGNGINGCVFDLDGTLADTAPDIAQALNAALHENGLGQLSHDDIVGMIGGGIPTLVERALTKLSEPMNVKDVLVTGMLDSYAGNYCDKTVLLPGVADCLLGVQARGLPMAVCTNKEQNLARKIVTALGLDDYFVTVVGRHPDLAKKPDPAMLLHAIIAIGCNAEEVMMIGDSDVDAQTAAAANCVSVIAQNGYYGGDYTALGADFLVPDMTPVLGIIDQLNAVPS